MTTETGTMQQHAYVPPALVVLGSVEAITLSSQTGSFSDMKGRTNRHP